MQNNAVRKTLMIIEDDVDILDILELIFRDEGYEVYSSATGVETHDLSTIKPDLILLDIRLSAGGNEGVEICSRLKGQEITRHIPIILLSAEMAIEHSCWECGANAFVKKPFDVDHLSSRVRELAYA